MEPFANAAITSWPLDVRVLAVLAIAGMVYLRGWLRGRRIVHERSDFRHLACFAGAFTALFLATQSPLEAFDTLYLWAHMAQHLLLMMIAPPLILLADPMLPFLRGLPRSFVKDGLGPFLTWHPLRALGGWLTRPPVAWAAFAGSTIFWHLPKFYELAVASPAWHGAEHACFFWTGVLFWWPVIRPKPARAYWPKWTLIPYLLSADIVNTAVSAAFVFSGRVLYPSYAAFRTGRMSALEDQTLAGLIMWVPGSVIYLVPAFVLVMSLFAQPQQRSTVVRVKPRRARRRTSTLRVVGPRFRRVAQVAMLMLAIAVVADGFRGPQVAAVNLAGVLPWIHWRGLSILALLVVGNVFCMACPFTLARDIARRVMPARWRWPRQLRTKWLSAALIVLYLWAYEAFGLWDSPWLTAWVILGYFAAIVVVDGFFRGASFCKYVCPIGQFHFVCSLVSPREIGVREPAVCKSCETHDCIRGNDRARGCELYLFQPKKAGNLDCTFCLDCVKACPHDNVGLVSIAPAQTLMADPYRSSIGRLSRRTDFAALAGVVVFGAFVNAAGMVAPVLMREHRWHARLGVHAMPLIVAFFVMAGVLGLPSLAVAACAGLNGWSGTREGVFDVMRRFVFALVPIGVAMWAAHLLYHLVTGWSAPVGAIERFLANSSLSLPDAVVPGWLTGAQISVLDAGLLLTLYVCWRVANQYAGRLREAIAVMAPWATVSIALYTLGVWILFQPMQMRGMMH